MKSVVLETGISDHHEIIMSFFRSAIAKGKPKIFYYRYYKNSISNSFKRKLKKI